MNFKVLLVGAIDGFIVAFMIDMNAWCKSTPKGEANAPFDWKLGPRRWAAGAIAGATTAIGWNVTVDF